MIKNLYTRSSLLLVYFVLSYSAVSHNTYEFNKTASVSVKQNTKPIIAFDLHGVIFNINHKEVIKKTALVFAQWNGLLLMLNPDFWLDLVLLFFNVRQFEHLLKRYPLLNNSFEELSDIIRGHELNAEMPAIISSLKSNNYTIYLFSNIAEKNFKKLLKQFPEIFAYFDGFVVAQPDDGWIQKPNKKAFEKFLAKVKTNPDNVILIDDNLNNIKVAQSLGFHTIHYTSVEQMLDDFRELQIPIEAL